MGRVADSNRFMEKIKQLKTAAGHPGKQVDESLAGIDDLSL